jgi:peptidoglycan hydrolase-like protein with peptidoglycan-binding domain
MLQALGWSARDMVACAVAVTGVVTIVVNVLFLQKGPHPAPMFKGSLMALPAQPPAPAEPPAALASAARDMSPVAAIPRARPTDAGPARTEAPKAEAAPPPAPTAAPRASTEVISDIQRELVRRGFYSGDVDGRYGPRTDTAIRDFEHAAGLRASTEPNEGLLQAIRRSSAKPAKPATTTGRAASPPVRNDPIADVLGPSKRVVAMQRALSEYGYGQLKPTGTIDADTRAAIEKFERERKLPVTGQASDRVARELAAITGRPLE